ncbi:MAG: MFS transporter [Actinomycetota bacterium]|nr:MFS transporter [Actinomycetota bacterium]
MAASTPGRRGVTRPSNAGTASHRKLLAVELGAFGFFGLWAGCFAVLLADLTRALDLSPGPLGFALFVGASASILAMATLGWTADRLGRRVFLLVVALWFGIGIVGVALAWSFVALVVALAVLSSATGLYDVGINASVVDLEQATGRRFMPLLHAAFSGGAMVGAVGAGVLIQAGADYRIVYLALLVPLAGVSLAVVAARFPVTTGGSSTGGAGGYGLTRHLPLLLIGAIATLGLLSEGEMEHWSGIYLRQTLGLPALLGGSGVAVFYGAMAVGRLGTAWAVKSFGNRRTLLASGLLTAAGMGLALATREPLLVVCGLLVVGLALSGVAPIAFSAAGDLAPERAGGAISVVTTLGYGGFLLGPVVVGGLAELFGLRAALGTVAAAGVLIFVLALRLKAA